MKVNTLFQWEVCDGNTEPDRLHPALKPVFQGRGLAVAESPSRLIEIIRLPSFEISPILKPPEPFRFWEIAFINNYVNQLVLSGTIRVAGP